MNTDALEIDVQVPESWHGFDQDAFCRRLEALVTDRAADLGLYGGGRAAATATSSSWLGVSVAGRPLLLLAGKTRAGRTADVAAQAAEACLLRRLPVLLGRTSRISRRSVAWYLTDLGIGSAPPPYLGVTTPEETLRGAAEEYHEALAPAEIVVEAAVETLKRTRADVPNDLPRLRRRVFASTGVQLPDVRLVPTDNPPGTVRIRANSVWITPPRLSAEAGWTEVVDALGTVVRARPHWFVRLGRVTETLDTMSYVQPDLAAACADAYPRPLLSACLRELVTHGESIRNLPRLLWLLLELGSAPAERDRVRLAESPLTPRERGPRGAVRDPVVLASRLRKCLVEESWRMRTYRTPDRAGRVPGEIEETLLGRPVGAALGEAEWRAVRAVAELDRPGLVVTRAVKAIAPVRAALQALPRPPVVVASHELPPDVDLTGISRMEDLR